MEEQESDKSDTFSVLISPALSIIARLGRQTGVALWSIKLKMTLVPRENL